MIDSECFNRLIKLIFDGPKNHLPLIDGIDFLSLNNLATVPEKLLHADFSFIILLTANLGKQIKLPNLIDCPVKTKLNICVKDNKV